MLPARFKHNPRPVACLGEKTWTQTPDLGPLTVELEDLQPDTWSGIQGRASRSCVHAASFETHGFRRFRLSGLEKHLRDLVSRLAALPATAQVSEEILGTIDASSVTRFSLQFPGGTLELGKTPLIMGVLNVTPDSFSDGGLFLEEGEALDRALEMVGQGADIIDVGGESTRPGAEAVDVADELRRVVPVIEKLAQRTAVPISIDTYKSRVATEAIEAGAKIVNDISALRFDSDMPSVVADYGVPVILMHILGTPRDMQQHPAYTDVVSEIIAYLRESLQRAIDAGIAWERTVIDPGIGFGKTVRHNLEIISRLSEFAGLGRPILIGTSRKSFVGKVLGLEVGERIFGTASTVAASVLAGAHIVRVHDVAEMKQVARMASAVRSPELVEPVTANHVEAGKL